MRKINERGRSMVEMLGVLAIIGVLSAGGLAGYSKGMHKYRINQTIEIFRHSLQRLAELEYMPWGDYTEIGMYNNTGVEDAVKYGLFPKEMCDEGYTDIRGEVGQSCQLPVGEISIDFVFSNHGDPMFGEYYITFTKGDKVQTCIDFLSQHWEKQTPAGWWKDRYEGVIYLWSDPFSEPIYHGLDGSTELTLDNIVTACNKACKADWCQIEMWFRNEA